VAAGETGIAKAHHRLPAISPDANVAIKKTVNML
jgi:hypothetical protein